MDRQVSDFLSDDEVFGSAGKKPAARPAPRRAAPRASGYMSDDEVFAPAASPVSFRNVRAGTSAKPADQGAGGFVEKALSLLNPDVVRRVSSVVNPLPHVIAGARRARVGDSFNRGAAATVAGIKHAGGEALANFDVMGNVYGALDDAGALTGDAEAIAEARDPAGLRRAAAEALAVQGAISAERQAGQVRTPSREQALADPGAALEAVLQRSIEGGAESALPMIGAVATRHPALASSVLGATTGAQTYTDLREKEVDRGDAIAAALLSALVERAGNDVVMPRIMAPRGEGSALGAAASGALQEAPVSLAQTNIEANATGEQVGAWEQLMGALESGLSGGGMSGGARAAFSAPGALSAALSPAPSAPAPASPSPRQAEAPVAAGPVAQQADPGMERRRAELTERINRDPDSVTDEEYAEWIAMDAEPPAPRVADPVPAPPEPRQAPPPAREGGAPPDDRLSPRESADARPAARPVDAPAVQPARADAEAPAVAVPVADAPARADAPVAAARAPEAVERPAGEGPRDNAVGRRTLDDALAMGEDDYIRAVNPEGKRGDPEETAMLDMAGIDLPANARSIGRFGDTDILEADDGLYAVVDGQVAGAIVDMSGQTVNHVMPEFRGRGLGRTLAREYVRRNPFAQSGGFTDAGEAARRSAYRELKAERNPEPPRVTVTDEPGVLEPRIIRTEGRAPEPEPVRGDAQNVRGEVGWDQRGGRMIREYDDGGLKPEVVGRTTWVGKAGPDGAESKLWRNRPDKNLTEAQANAALDKAARGEPLRPIEQRFVDYAASVDAEYQQASRDAVESERASEEWHNRGDRAEARDERARADADEGGQPADERPRPAGVEPTGTKNAVTDAERDARGAEPIEPASKLSNEALLRQATDALTADPQAAQPIIARLLNEGVTNISARDEAILMAHKQTLRVRRQRAIDALEDPNTGDYERLAAKAEFAAAEAEINALDNAVRNSGREWGRFGQFRQRMLGEDWTLEAMERRHRAVLERPLTAKERAEVKALADQLQRSEAELEDVRAKLAEAQVAADVSSTYKNLVSEIAKALGGKRPRGGDRLARLRTAADEAKARLATNAGVPSKRGQSGALDVRMLADYATIGSYHIAKGVSDFATWARDMLDELGETFRRLSPSEKRQVFDASKAAHEADLAATQAVKTPAAVLEGMDPEAITHRDVYNLARAHAQAGVRGEGPLMQATHADIQKIAPEMTERDVRRLFSDYGRATFPSKDEDRVALREVRVLVQLQESIDRLQEGLDALKSGPQRDKPTQEIREKRRQLNDLLKWHMQRRGIPEDRLATYNQVRITNLKNQIADLEKQIATGEKPVRAKTPDPSAEVIALTAERDRLKAELKAIEDAKKPVKSEDEKYQERTGKRLARELQRIRDRIKADDYAKPDKPVPRALSDANTRLQREVQAAKIEFSVRQFEAEMAKRGRVSRALMTAGNAMNLSRAMMTSLDLSATLRQGGFITLGHPVRGAKALFDGIRAARSDDRAFGFEQDIASRPNASLYTRAKLELTRSDSYKPSLAEEQFMSRWADKMSVWIGGGLIRGSQRAFTTTLNRIRADTFDAMVESLVQNRAAPTQLELETIANFVNVATGRGRVRIGSKELTGLNTVFFAPKLVASRFQLLAGSPMWGGTARTRMLIAEEYARFLTGTLAALGLLTFALGDEDDEGEKLKLETDPRSANFLRVKVGNAYIDPMAGLAQVTRLVTTIATDEKVTTTGKVRPTAPRGPRLQNELADVRKMAARVGIDNVVSLDGLPEAQEIAPVPYGGDNNFDVAMRFLRSKLAPVPAAAVNVFTGENMIGEPTTIIGEAAGLVAPLSFRDVDKIMRESGVLKGSALMALNLLGFGVQYRDPEKDYTKLSDEEYAERYEPSDDPRQ